MSLHTLHLIIVFALVATVFTAFLREWASPDLVALSAMGVLLITGVPRKSMRHWTHFRIPLITSGR